MHVDTVRPGEDPKLPAWHRPLHALVDRPVAAPKRPARQEAANTLLVSGSEDKMDRSWIRTGGARDGCGHRRGTVRAHGARGSRGRRRTSRAAATTATSNTQCTNHEMPVIAASLSERTMSRRCRGRRSCLSSGPCSSPTARQGTSLLDQDNKPQT